MKDVDTGHGLARRSHSQWPGLKPRSFLAQSLSIFRSFLGFGDTEHLPRAGATRRSQRSPHHRVSEQKGVRGRRRGPREGRGRGRVCGGSEDTGAPGYPHGDPQGGLQSPGLSQGDTRPRRPEPDELGRQDRGTAPGRSQGTAPAWGPFRAPAPPFNPLRAVTQVATSTLLCDPIPGLAVRLALTHKGSASPLRGPAGFSWKK